MIIMTMLIMFRVMVMVIAIMIIITIDDSIFIDKVYLNGNDNHHKEIFYDDFKNHL